VIGAIFGFVLGLIVIIAGLFSGTGALLLAGVVSIVILTIFFLVGGFISAAIAAIVYNFIASKIGGIAVYFKSDRLYKVGPLSYAKIEGILGAVIGFLIGLLYTVLALNPVVGTTGLPGIVQSVGVFAIVIFPIFYFILLFLAAGLDALLYNYFAKRIKGVEVRFSS
jgi:ABC-type multidrug transport system fused ATPase/permease subunit